MLSNLLFLVGSVVMMLWLNWRLFLIGIVLLPASVLALRHYQNRLAPQVRAMRERSADIGSFLIETLQGMRLVVTSGAEVQEAERFRGRNRAFVKSLLDMQLTSYFAGGLPGTIMAVSSAILFLYGGKLVIDGKMTVGALVAILAYHMRLLGPVQSMLSVYTSLVTGAVSLGRVFELLDAPIEVTERAGAEPLPDPQGAITFENVRFSYDRETAVLDSVSFHVPAGSICAIVGPSGVGKSTIADLILRLYDPDSGSVRLDGQDLRDLRFSDLRETIALVDQAPHLFHASIRENIAYARPEATEDEIFAAARSAAIHDFIAALPDGYSTLVGERGLALSAGQRQRIAIARAMLRRAKVLVLDEPTASLDAAAEKSIAESLGSFIHGQTAIVITHRPSLAEIADQVILLDAGRVVERVCASKA
jgi:ATP-binding cassette, subfamily B, bacterial